MSNRIIGCLVALTLSTLPVVAADPWPLFTTVPDSEAINLLTRAELEIENQWAISSVRRNYVLFDPGQLTSLGKRIVVEFNLFPDTFFTSLLLAEHDSRRYAWEGTLDGVDGGHAGIFLSRLATFGESVAASIVREPGTTYRIRKAGDGDPYLYAVEQVDFPALPDEEPPAPVGVAKKSESGGESAAGTADIAILYLYTPDLSPPGIESTIYGYESDTNNIFANSNVDAQITVVDIREFVPDFSGPDGSWVHQLAQQASDLRDEVGADLVQLVTGFDLSYCGIANGVNGSNGQPLNPEVAFSMTRIDCGSGLTPTHEFGHLMGAAHAPDDAVPDSTYHPGMFGYKNPSPPHPAEPYRTVMASTQGGCPECTRIEHFSSATITYFGLPTGNADQDNANGLDLTAPVVAGFRDAPQGTYTLTVTIEGTGSGHVTSSPTGIDCPSDCQESYDEGTTVNLTATADPGSTFVGWSGDAACTDGVVSGDSDCIATFDSTPPGTHTLTVTLEGTGGGTVTTSPAGINCPSDCQEAYDEGTTVNLIATADGDSTFVGWSGDGACTDGVVVMNNDRNCTATFDSNAPGTHTLTVTLEGTGGGTVTTSPAGINCPSDCQEAYDEGTTVNLIATADGDSTFVGWSGDGACTDGVVVMNNDRNCTATFDQGSSDFVVQVSAAVVDPNSTIVAEVTSTPTGLYCSSDGTPNQCQVTVEAGDSITLHADITEDPIERGIFENWSGPNCPVSGSTSPDVTLAVIEDINCVAHFKCNGTVPQCIGGP